jgi:Taurine catabolism dioxygenase TauD, TfdA family
MLQHKKDLALGIGQFALENVWKNLYIQVDRVLESFYGAKDCTKFSPEVDETVLAREILSIPGLKELHQQVLELKKEGYCAMFIDKFGLQSFSTEKRNKLLFAFSLALGFPTPTDPRQGQLLWDVKARSLPKGHFATFSEHSDRAELHTDTQYYQRPEDYFFLYVVQAARCGGGKSLLCDGREIQSCLLETPGGQQAFEVLSTFPFPFRIPTTFTQSGTANAVETTLAPIFGSNPGEPLIRFRHDTLEKGFQARPDLDVPEAREALRVLHHVLENKANILSYYMQDDDLLLCDNHKALHGRTIYLDRSRHCVRVRMDRTPVTAKRQLAARELTARQLTPAFAA